MSVAPGVTTSGVLCSASPWGHAGMAFHWSGDAGRLSNASWAGSVDHACALKLHLEFEQHGVRDRWRFSTAVLTGEALRHESSGPRPFTPPRSRWWAAALSSVPMKCATERGHDE